MLFCMHWLSLAVYFAMLRRPLTTLRTPRKKRRLQAVVSPEGNSSSDRYACRSISRCEAVSDDGFIDLQVSPAELRPSTTLTNGQCFNWKDVTETPTEVEKKTSAWGSHNASQWIGTIRNSAETSIVMMIRETPTTTLFKVLGSSDGEIPSATSTAKLLHRYFQLDVCLSDLYVTWSERCPRMKRITERIRGVRIVDQDPWECLVSFLCSSNNNIPRISKMVGSIRKEFGSPILRLSDGDEETIFYSFPSFHDLSKATDSELREKCGMGYRAKYLLGTIGILQDKDENYLASLRSIKNPKIVQEALVEFPGVGRKVADCVALFSLKQTEACPVDVHVWNIARRDYMSDQRKEALANVTSLTPKVYDSVADLFREKFGKYSGWAHSVLFVAELPSFRPVLPEELIEEMERFKAEEKERKKSGRSKELKQTATGSS